MLFSANWRLPKERLTHKSQLIAASVILQSYLIARTCADKPVTFLYAMDLAAFTSQTNLTAFVHKNNHGKPLKQNRLAH